MLTFPYEQAESPPAPYVDLQVSPSRRAYLRVAYRGKLDSGASITIIPTNLVQQWHLRRIGDVQVLAFDGTLSVRPLYRVNIIIGSRQFRRVEVTVAHRTNILLGRDILNQLTITHNGPQLRVEIQDA
jgi:predicted aspartyl protease